MPECSRPIVMVNRFLLAAAALACAACTTVPVGTPLESKATAAAPAVTPGDTWTYRVRDGFTGLERGTRTVRVTQLGQDRINATVEEGGLQQVQIYDRNWNWLERPGTNLPYVFTYQPAYEALAFPLVPGKTWHGRLIATSVKDGRRFPVSVDGSVLGWEKVRVPAGEFDAIRVRRIVYFDYFEMMVRGQAQTIEQEWYAPEVKQLVRRETSGMYLSWIYGQRESPFVRTTNDDGGGPRMVPDDWLIAELVSYSVR
jgi:hypothetical protein